MVRGAGKGRISKDSSTPHCSTPITCFGRSSAPPGSRPPPPSPDSPAPSTARPRALPCSDPERAFGIPIH
jgi:hypothetical protein